MDNWEIFFVEALSKAQEKILFFEETDKKRKYKI